MTGAVRALFLLALLLAGPAAAQPHLVTPDAIPVWGDFDGDHILDDGVILPLAGTPAARWIVACSSGGWINVVMLSGPATSIPAAADFDGDGQTDVRVFYAPTRSYYGWSSRWPGWFYARRQLGAREYYDLAHVLDPDEAPVCGWGAR